ncbi:MAG: hypothetical protein HWN80_08865 [Candidatus Lokiarchaeota archaeon]|nr:hypothetical protein [Candidatus Lokiarchaeota archaeon]
MRIINLLKPNKKVSYTVLVLICIFIIFPSLPNLQMPNYQILHNKDQNIKSSGIWATLDLINPVGINNSRFTHNSIISVQGRLFNRIPPGGEGKPDYAVAIEVDDVVFSNFNDVTDSNGYFQIDFIIDPSLDIYSSHKIEATVIDSTPDTVEYRTHYIINVNTTSYFDVNAPVNAKLIGEFYDFDFDDYLRQLDDSAIPSSLINYYWYDGPVIVDSNFVFTDGSGLIQPIFIPDIGITNLDLRLTFELSPDIGYSEIWLTNMKLFSNISCIWSLPTTITASSDLRISGQVVSREDPSLAINKRFVDIFYEGSFVQSVQTDLNGRFSVVHSLPDWTGQASISVQLPNALGKNLSTQHFVTIQTPSTPPFLLFFSIFLPIIGVVVGGLAFYGYRYYKKQNKLSKVVNLPLEDKIVNLKILKESGRLEESLSYLFIAIYMDLIGAKFGRIRKNNETIRDFAIISVKNLNLSPATIYPFIQKVEEIIYAKPFQITDKEFYRTIKLFSPVYYELTGFNFELNF